VGRGRPRVSARAPTALARCPYSLRWVYVDPETNPPPWTARRTRSLCAPCVAQDGPVLEGAGLALGAVGDDEAAFVVAAGVEDREPLAAGPERAPATAAQARQGHLLGGPPRTEGLGDPQALAATPGAVGRDRGDRVSVQHNVTGGCHGRLPFGGGRGCAWLGSGPAPAGARAGETRRRLAHRCRRPVATAGAAGVQRTAVRWKVRTAAAVSATANRVTTPRLSDAMAVWLLMPQISWRPAPLSPASP
jgi:hypothetical protein